MTTVGISGGAFSIRNESSTLLGVEHVTMPTGSVTVPRASRDVSSGWLAMSTSSRVLPSSLIDELERATKPPTCTVTARKRIGLTTVALTLNMRPATSATGAENDVLLAGAHGALTVTTTMLLPELMEAHATTAVPLALCEADCVASNVPGLSDEVPATCVLAVMDHVPVLNDEVPATYLLAVLDHVPELTDEVPATCVLAVNDLALGRIGPEVVMGSMSHRAQAELRVYLVTFSHASTTVELYGAVNNEPYHLLFTIARVPLDPTRSVPSTNEAFTTSLNATQLMMATRPPSVNKPPANRMKLRATVSLAELNVMLHPTRSNCVPPDTTTSRAKWMMVT